MESKGMKFSILLSSLLFILVGCSTIRYVPIETNTVVSYRDSISYKTDTVFVELPKVEMQRMNFYTDTLNIYTDLAEAKVWVDTNDFTLNGIIKNKNITLPIEYLYKERIIVKDSLVYKDVPVEVEVVKEVKTHYWYERLLWLFSIVGIVNVIVFVMKMKR